MIPTVVQVALGGALGASLRYGVNVLAARLVGAGFPVATLVVNVLGSFLMGLLAAALLERGEGRLAPFLLTGVLGGFTTFSAFSLDAVRLWERGEATAAAGYVAASVVLSIAGLALGLGVARHAP
jgi:CrcB protein